MLSASGKHQFGCSSTHTVCLPSLQLQMPTGKVTMAGVSMGGRFFGKWKSENQDAFFVRTLAQQDSSAKTAHAQASDQTGSTPSVTIVGVFDGHGLAGRAVSQRVCQSMVDAVTQTSWGFDPRSAMPGTSLLDLLDCILGTTNCRCFHWLTV